jgi:hypothetical protein
MEHSLQREGELNAAANVKIEKKSKIWGRFFVHLYIFFRGKFWDKFAKKFPLKMFILFVFLWWGWLKFLAFWGAFNFFKYTQWQCICVKF